MEEKETAPEVAVEEPKAEKTKASPKKAIQIKDLLDAGLHFGHQTKRWNPKMRRYIFDKRNGIHIIDLKKSLALLNEALEYIDSVVSRGKSVLFVGTKKQAQVVIKDTAVECNQFYINSRWLGGTMTNSATIKKSIKRMKELEALQKEEGFSTHKKEASRLRREHEKLARNLSGIADMGEKPGVLFVVDIKKEAIAVNEARKLGIPVVAIVDTCCDPDDIDFIIPGNDDSIRSIKLILGAVSGVVKVAHAEYAKKAAAAAKKAADAKAAAEAKTKAKAEAEAKAKKEAAKEKKAADAKKKPVGKKADEKKPAADKKVTEEKKPAAKKEAAKDSKPATEKPAAKKKVAKKAEEKKPAAKKTEEKKPAAKKPAAKKKVAKKTEEKKETKAAKTEKPAAPKAKKDDAAKEKK